MAEEQKPTTNVEAEQDVQNVLAELKGDTGAEEKATKEDAGTEKAAKEDAEEARIVAEAAKLGQKSEQSEEKPEQPRESRGYQRGGRFRNNAKFDPSSQKETDDPVEIRKQVEFYFSDSNLPMDKFLLSQVGGSANKAVPLSVVHSFKRMRRFQPFSAVVEALKTSETLDLVENDTAVKRKVPLPDSVSDEHSSDTIKVFEDKAMARSIYVKGFGEEGPSTQFEIEEFFAPYGPINAIRLRRFADKTFKGSAFVEFGSEDKQKEFLALEKKPQWKDEDLLIKSKKEYCDEKVEEIKAGKVKPSTSRGRGGGRGRGRGRGGGRGGRNDRDWRERRAEDQKNGFKDNRQTQKDSRGVPVIASTADDKSAGQKRTRDDEANGDHPAKKVDAKE